MIKKNFDPLAPCKHKDWRYMFNQKGEPTFKYCCDCSYFEEIRYSQKSDFLKKLIIRS
jgi:hypothetical protein